MAGYSVYFQVVGTGTDGTDPGVFLSVEQHYRYSSEAKVLRRYLFNAGEGTQRLFMEKKIKLSTIDKVLLTRIDPEATAGLPGVILGLADAGAASVAILGPHGTKVLTDSYRHFIRRKHPQVTVLEVNASSPGAEADVSSGETIQWQDPLVDIIPVLVTAAEDSSRSKSTCALCLAKDRNDLRKTSHSATGATQDEVGRRNMLGTDLGRFQSAKFMDPQAVRLQEFYVKHDKTKVHHIATILSRYSGRIAELERQLEAKYGEAPRLSLIEPQEHEQRREILVHSNKRLKRDVAPTSDTAEPCANSQSNSSTATEVDAEDRDTSRGESDGTQHLDRVASVMNLRIEIDQKNGPSEKDGAGEALQDKAQFICYICRFAEPEQPGAELRSALPYRVVLIVDCPTPTFIQPLKSALVTQLQCDRLEGGLHEVSAIIHFTPPAVSLNAKYLEWMQGFGSKTSHFMLHGNFFDNPVRTVGGSLLNLGDDGAPFPKDPAHGLRHFLQINFGASMKTLVKHNHLDPASFSLPLHKMISGGEIERQQRQVAVNGSTQDSATTCRPGSIALSIAGFPSPCAIGLQGSRLVMRKPQVGFTETLVFDNSLCSWVATEEKERRGPLRAPGTGGECSIHSPDGSQIVFLGTGSARPSKFRSSSAIYIRFPNSKKGILLDAGEGCLGQLWRKYGTETDKVISSLVAIWISHKHADHHCGLSKLLARFELLRKRLAPAAASKATPLLVIAPSAVLEHLTEITCKVYSYTSSPLRLRGCLNTDFNDRNHPANIWLRTNSIITNLESVPVHHCHEAFAAVLEVDSPQEGVEEGSNNGNRIRSTIKLVYSGDTRPCDRLIQKGRNADLLIHEATFEDDLEEDALQKRHSTISEALTVAARMKAAATVLTHFSQRYPNVPEGVVKFSGSAKLQFCLASDLLTIGMSKRSFSRMRDIADRLLPSRNRDGEEE